jgi:protein-S-isoprenylcysteine O-methyltransferase Ste14
VFGLFFTGSLFGASPISITIQVAAGLLMVWARVTFGARSFHAAANATEGGLVTSGPYRYLRHPIYVAILYFVWAGIGAHLSVGNALLGVGASGMLALRMYCEEIFLRRAYREYSEYEQRTARVVPFVL